MVSQIGRKEMLPKSTLKLPRHPTIFQLLLLVQLLLQHLLPIQLNQGKKTLQLSLSLKCQISLSHIGETMQKAKDWRWIEAAQKCPICWTFATTTFIGRRWWLVTSPSTYMEPTSTSGRETLRAPASGFLEWQTSWDQKWTYFANSGLRTALNRWYLKLAISSTFLWAKREVQKETTRRATFSLTCSLVQFHQTNPQTTEIPYWCPLLSISVTQPLPYWRWPTTSWRRERRRRSLPSVWKVARHILNILSRGWTGIGMEESKLRQKLKFCQDFPFFQPIPVQPLILSSYHLNILTSLWKVACQINIVTS